MSDALTENERGWASWLALSDGERAERIAWARSEVDVDGRTTNRLFAAKVLHGQPFGFTWEDVDLLRNIDPHDVVTPTLDAMHALGDRIAALLPPRES